MSIINTIFSSLFAEDLPGRWNSFVLQKKLLWTLLTTYVDSPLYQTIGLKQDQTLDLVSYSEAELKEYIAQFPLVEYHDHILPLVQGWLWITSSDYDLQIKTSGTSDAYQWWKLIPAQWSSFDMELTGVKRTLSYYLQENNSSSVLTGRWFSLTAPFDEIKKMGYVSGAIRAYTSYSDYLLLPSQDLLTLQDRQIKKQKIVEQLLTQKKKICSFHGVPTRWIDIVYDLIETDRATTISILDQCEYISIGGGPALGYKQQFQDIMTQLWLSNRIYGSNNHNASEWFLGSQLFHFADLNYHWMVPLIQMNFFLFIPVCLYDQYIAHRIDYSTLITSSHFLHEVEVDQEYLMCFANHRIPRLYNIKDKVCFQDTQWWTCLEYSITGRYGMSSNLFSERIEVNHIVAAIQTLQNQWYQLDAYNFVAGMQVQGQIWFFHIMIEADENIDSKTLSLLFDKELWKCHDRWALLRQRGKISSLQLYMIPSWSLRKNLIALNKLHEQSKIPHLSDHNYEVIVEPLLKKMRIVSS